VVAAHVWNVDRHTAVHRRQHRRGDRSARRAPARSNRPDAPPAGRVPPRRPDAAVCRRRTGANRQPSVSGSHERDPDGADARAASGAWRRRRAAAWRDGARNRARTGQSRDCR
jgi:hypothetical protein